MDEIRVNAALAEMNALITSLIQRIVNFAGDLATANKLLADAQKQIEELKKPRVPEYKKGE